MSRRTLSDNTRATTAGHSVGVATTAQFMSTSAHSPGISGTNGRMVDLIFDVTVFPEVASSRPHQAFSASSESNGDASSYESPVVAICNEVRRRNVAAAWSSPLTFPMSSGSSGPLTPTSTDPWENYQDPLLNTAALNEDGNIDGTNLWNCSAVNKRSYRKRSVSRASPKRGAGGTATTQSQPSNINYAKATATATAGFQSSVADSPQATTTPSIPSKLPAKLSSSTVMVASSEEQDPQHARSLLETTPQLRLLAPQSTDMNGGSDRSSQHSFFHRVLAGGQGDSSIQASGSGTGTGTSGNTGATGTKSMPPSLGISRENHRAAAELASLLWTLAHEMSLEDFGAVESQVFTAVFGLVHDYNEQAKRLAGMAAIHALLAAPSADEEKKSIKFANALSQALRTAGGDFELLSSVAAALGKMARLSANVDLGKFRLFSFATRFRPISPKKIISIVFDS